MSTERLMLVKHNLDEEGMLEEEGMRSFEVEAAAGPAGTVALAFASGLAVGFDKMSGRLSSIEVPVGCSSELLERLFSSGAGAIARRETNEVVLVDESLATRLFRLALLEAVRQTDPVCPESVLWVAEAALLAHTAGLGPAARRDAIGAAPALAELVDALPGLVGELGEVIEVVCMLAEGTEPAVVERLRRQRDEPVARGIEDELIRMQRHWQDERAPVHLAGELDTEPVFAQLSAFPLDALVVPEGVFRFGPEPSEDLHWQSIEGTVELRAALQTAFDPSGLARCQARLTDPQTREVLAFAAFERTPGTFEARTRLVLPAPRVQQSLAIEVVGDTEAPVEGPGTRHVRAALRWADAALRAERRPRALHFDWSDEEWATWARSCWGHCAAHWEEAEADDLAEAADRRAGEGPGAVQPFLAEASGQIGLLGAAE